MTTYELIRQLAKLDPDGDMQVMLSVKTCSVDSNGNELERWDAVGPVESFSIEHVEDGAPSWIVIESVDI